MLASVVRSLTGLMKLIGVGVGIGVGASAAWDQRLKAIITYR